MSKTIFQNIDRYLHFANNEAPEVKNDPLGKVRKILNLLNKRFVEHFIPGEYLALDEGMIPFNGKCYFK